MMIRSIALGGAVVLAIAVQGQNTRSSVRIYHPVSTGVSPALRDVATQPSSVSLVPESTASTTTTKNISAGLNFGGMSSTGTYLAPDPNGAVGTTQYVQWTNARYAVYNKSTGAVIVAPTAAKLLWAGLGGPCGNTNAGDGVVLFDKAAQRWVITHHSGGNAPLLQCLAISTTSDASGTYYLYAFQLTTQYPDYPKIGSWPDAYYVTMNLLNPSTYASLGAEVCALDRTSMLAGSPAASAQCFVTGTATTDYVLLPSDVDGATAPPAGAPNYLLSLNSNSLDFFTFHVDWLNLANSSLTGPTNIPVTPFTQACNGGYCVSQLGTTNVVDGVGDRLSSNRIPYRNFGDHESLLVNHSINNNTGASVGIRWYELRSPGSAPFVYQAGTWQPDANFRWMGSMAMDKMGNILIGYNRSSASTYPAIFAAGRLSTDTLGSLEPEGLVTNGAGSETGSGDQRWGDYTSMSVDPIDDCTLWYTGEYYKASGTAWSTRITSFRFSGCQ